MVRRSGGELWLHEAGRLDLEKYQDPDEAVDRRMLMLADHGLYGRELTESSEGLLDWLPVMPSIATPDRLLSGGERLDVGDRSWEVVHTPGHSPGSISLVGDTAVFSGDVLFADSIGRSDLPGGDTDTLVSSIHGKLFVLPDDLPVYPGHGPPTTIGKERELNPFVGSRGGMFPGG